MSYDKASLIRQLVPTSYHFDGYNRIKCQNSRDRPFFSDNVIQFGDNYHLSIQLVNENKIILNFSSICAHGKITFKPYSICLEDFVSKLKEAVRSNRDFIPFEISVQYNSNVSCHLCQDKNKDCDKAWKDLPEKIFAGVSFNFNEMKEALATYFEITNIKTPIGGKNNMKKGNKFFGLNFELGVSKDSNIASTLMGLSVRNPKTGNWYVFDAKTNTRKNLSTIQMGNFPVILLPTQQLNVGRLYKENGQYCFLKSVNPNGTVTFMNAADGIIYEQIPEEGLIPGMNFHTEVIAFDATTMMNANSKDNVAGNILAAILMMNWSKGNNAEFSLDSINDDSFNGMGSYLPMLLMGNAGNLGNMFTNPDGTPNIAMLLALGSDDSENNEMMQMMVLSQLLSGGTNTFSNLIPSQNNPAAPASENKLICESCGISYPDGTNFCPKCGGKTKLSANTCKACGATLTDGAAFCHKCGSKVGPATCDNCGKELDAEANFCPSCGIPCNGHEPTRKVTEVADTQSNVASETVTEPTA